MKVIILAGGSGTRLWPLSRTNYPKQFLKLKQRNESLFQITMQRSLKLCDLSDIYIVTNEKHKFLVVGQLEEMGLEALLQNILVEPESKNTLPAIYYAVQEIQKKADDTVVVFSSDHIIDNEDVFINTIKQGIDVADHNIVLFGVKPDRPHTGYGYIKPGKKLSIGFQVDEFKEKPNEETARHYVEKGYLWNSGMFMFRTDVFSQKVKRYAPEVYQAFREPDTVDKFSNSPSVSVDYGLLEKTNQIAVMPLAIRWSDLGSFEALYEEFPSDNNDNITFGNEVVINSQNNLLYTDQDKSVAVIGVENLIVVDEKDALLICKNDQSQHVKTVVDKMRQKQDKRVDEHLTTYRPWGSYTVLEEGTFYKIKRITVLPGKRLSYQLHNHRSEHWVVVKGTAKVTIEGEETLVRNGESTYVKSGYNHRLENPGKITLEVIEVQLGEYLEEDDIVRLVDDFGRGK